MGNCKKTIDLGNIVITIEDVRPSVNHSCGCSVPQHRVAPMREPKGGEGIMVAVQKPQREFYDCGWRGEQTYRDHIRKYANLENAARACNWPNDLVDSGAIKWPVPQNGGVVSHSNGCGCPNYNWNRPIPQPQREVRQKCGIPPIGAKVVAHRWGEPVFDR